MATTKTPKAPKAKKPRKPKTYTRNVIKTRRARAKRKPREAKDITTSKAELNFMAFLMAIGIPVQSQFKLSRKWYDFIVVGSKIIIEFDGDYYHCNPAVYPNGPINAMQRKAVLNDRKKNALAVGDGYTLIRVWEKDFNERPATVKQRLLEELKDYVKQPSSVPKV